MDNGSPTCIKELDCNYKCKTCVNLADNCTSCADPTNRLETPNCLCKEGTVDNGTPNCIICKIETKTKAIFSNDLTSLLVSF